MDGRRSFLVGGALAIVGVLQGCGGGGTTPAPPAPPTPPLGPTTPPPPTLPPPEAPPKGEGIGVYLYDHLVDASATFTVYTGKPTKGGWVQRPEAESKFEDWDINAVKSFTGKDQSAHGGLKYPGAGEMKIKWSNGKTCTLTYSSNGPQSGVCAASSDCGDSKESVKAVDAEVDSTCASVTFSMNVVPDPNAGPPTPAPATSPAPPGPPVGPTSPPAPSGEGIGVYVWDHLHSDPDTTFKLHTGTPSTGSWVSRPHQSVRDWGSEDTRSFYKVDQGAHGGLAVPGSGTMQVEWTSTGVAGKKCTLTYSSDGKKGGACSASTDCGTNAAGVAVVSASVDATTCQSITFSADVAPPSTATTEALTV